MDSEQGGQAARDGDRKWENREDREEAISPLLGQLWSAVMTTGDATDFAGRSSPLPSAAHEWDAFRFAEAVAADSE